MNIKQLLITLIICFLIVGGFLLIETDSRSYSSSGPTDFSDGPSGIPVVIHDSYETAKKTPPNERTNSQWGLIIVYEQEYDFLENEYSRIGKNMHPDFISILKEKEKRMEKYSREEYPSNQELKTLWEKNNKKDF